MFIKKNEGYCHFLSQTLFLKSKIKTNLKNLQNFNIDYNKNNNNNNPNMFH